MPGSLSAYAELKLLDHFFKVAAFTVPSNIYIGLSTADPTDAGSGLAEPSGNNYARVQCNTWDAAATSSGKARSANTGAITFPEPSGAWGNCTHFAGFDASTAGNMLFHCPLDNAANIVAGDTPEFAAGALDITLSGKLADAVNEDLLDHLLKVASMTQPANLYVALSTADPGATGSGLAEPGSGAYARVQNNIWDAAATSGGLGRTANTGAIVFPTATGAWGTITWAALMSAASAGTFLGRMQLATSRSVITGATPRFKAGEIDWTSE